MSPDYAVVVDMQQEHRKGTTKDLPILRPGIFVM